MLNYRVTSVFFILLLLVLAGIDMHNRISLWVYVIVLLAWAILLSMASIFLSWNFYLRSVHRAKPDQPGIALTFDDGPHPVLTPEVLNILKAHHINAAFFLIGRHAANNPALVKRIDEEGHVLGNHGFSHHFFFDLFPARKMQEEIRQTTEAVEEVTGRRMRWFRPPYGVTNPMLARAIRRSGYTSVGWSLKSRDTVITGSREVTERILTRIRPGDILLFHDSRDVVPAVLNELIPALKSRGFTFVRPDLLLNLNAYEDK